MLATKGVHVPVDPAWSHEVKWDGVRVLADTVKDGRGGTTRLLSRNENPVTVAWPELHRSPLGDRDLLVDGEVIALNERGLPDFRVLQDRMHVRNAAAAARLAGELPATYMVFDVMRLDGRDLTAMPLGERRKILADLGLEHSTWQVPAAYDDGPMLFEATLQQGLEGIVSKRLASRYSFGERSKSWLKFAHRHRRSYVVGGWRPQEGTTDRLAALLVGEMTPEGLLYRGRVGSGIGGTASRSLTPLVAPLGRDDSPFADEVPRVDSRGTFWLEPVLVVDVETHGLGYERLRQPSYRGVRDDLTPADLADQS
jgi:bifunctional non-homologous end joining protein LigD